MFKFLNLTHFHFFRNRFGRRLSPISFNCVLVSLMSLLYSRGVNSPESISPHTKSSLATMLAIF